MENFFPLADLGSDVAPLIACIGIFMVPIVAILTAHQRKMAQLIHGNHQNRQVEHQDALSSEVRDLKQIVYQQSIAIDAISSKLDKMSSPEVQTRLSGIEH